MSIWHLLILLLILLLVFGPQKIEAIGTSLGRAVRGFKKGLEEENSEKKQEAASKEDPGNLPKA